MPDNYFPGESISRNAVGPIRDRRQHCLSGIAPEEGGNSRSKISRQKHFGKKFSGIERAISRNFRLKSGTEEREKKKV